MPQIALPVRLYERRKYEGHSLETNSPKQSTLSLRKEGSTKLNVRVFQPTLTVFGNIAHVANVVSVVDVFDFESFLLNNLFISYLTVVC
mgnify:CR=1 FL=1